MNNAEIENVRARFTGDDAGSLPRYGVERMLDTIDSLLTDLAVAQSDATDFAQELAKCREYAELQTRTLGGLRAVLSTIHDRHYDEMDCDEDAAGDRTPNRDMHTVTDCNVGIGDIDRVLAKVPLPAGMEHMRPNRGMDRADAEVRLSGWAAENKVGDNMTWVGRDYSLKQAKADVRALLQSTPSQDFDPWQGACAQCVTPCACRQIGCAVAAVPLALGEGNEIGDAPDPKRDALHLDRYEIVNGRDRNGKPV